MALKHVKFAFGKCIALRSLLMKNIFLLIYSSFAVKLGCFDDKILLN